MRNKVIGWVVVILLILWIAYNPGAAATAVSGIAGFLWSIAAGLGSFFNALLRA